MSWRQKGKESECSNGALFKLQATRQMRGHHRSRFTPDPVSWVHGQLAGEPSRLRGQRFYSYYEAPDERRYVKHSLDSGRSSLWINILMDKMLWTGECEEGRDYARVRLRGDLTDWDSKYT